MSHPSRLLGWLIILAALSTPCWAKMDIYTPPKKATSNDTYPLSGPIQSVTASESTTAPTTNTKAAAPVVESPKMGNGRCDAGNNNHLQKTLLLTAFPRQTAHEANMGDLAEVDHQLPQLLGAQLNDHHMAITPSILAEGLPLAGDSSDQWLTQQIQQVARRQHTQMVLTGRILDMSMSHPDATYDPGIFTRVINGAFDFVDLKNPIDKRDRIFSMDIDLRDGFTGQRLFSKRYSTYGIWGETGDVGFASPLFWKTDYGQQIKGLLKKASREIGDVIQCQPFIALIDNRPGQAQVLLQGGANNGLHTGDTLALYQLVVQGSETAYSQYETRLVNRNIAIQLNEVYPSYSVGVINSTSYLNGQFLAVAP